MADYGMRVVNANGYVQIDSTYKNLGLRTKGSVVSAGTVTSTGWYPATVTVPAGNAPVIATRPSSGYCFLISTGISGGNITWTFYCSAAGVALSYWVFDDPSLGAISANDKYGLIVRNNVGSPVFDSRIDYMRVIGQFAGAGSANPDTTLGYSGYTPAIVQSQWRYQWAKTQTGSQLQLVSLFGLTFSLSGSSVAFSTQNPATYQAPLTDVVNTQPLYAYSYLILDVTNM